MFAHADGTGCFLQGAGCYIKVADGADDAACMWHSSGGEPAMRHTRVTKAWEARGTLDPQASPRWPPAGTTAKEAAAVWATRRQWDSPHSSR